MAVALPAPYSSNPLMRVVRDLRTQRRARRTTPYPPGETSFSVRRTRAMVHDPLSVLLPCYERHGPVFCLRVMHDLPVFMLGPEANHYITVSHADNFSWREGFMGDLIPLLGDGLLTIDGEFHRRSRRIMLPAFHRERIAAALGTIAAEVDAGLSEWHDGRLDLYAWTRRIALRVAMRALFGLDPDSDHARMDAAQRFETALGFYGRDYVQQMLRGPGTPWRRMQHARRDLDAIIYAEIARRRAGGERGEDVLSLLLDAEHENGAPLDDRLIRDEVMTLMFAGHDTTTSTVAFLFWELARHPEIASSLRAELDAVLGGAPASAQQLMGGALPQLDRAIEETLRLYPAAWIGPRRSREPFEFAGQTVPAGVPVNYSSWASHRLPDVWDRAAEFVPDRWRPEARARIPKGAYVPFGGGSRTCIGMRFGELEIRVIAARILARFEFQLAPGYRLRIRQMPTISPRDGLPLVIRARGARAGLSRAA